MKTTKEVMEAPAGLARPMRYQCGICHLFKPYGGVDPIRVTAEDSEWCGSLLCPECAEKAEAEWRKS